MTAKALVLNSALAPSALADRAALLRAANIVLESVERKNTYPILANVRLRGDGKTMFLTGTNLDVMIDVAVPAAADPALDVTVPAHMFRDLLKGAPKAADMVSLSLPEPTRKVRREPEQYIDSESGEEATRYNEIEYFEADPTLTVDFESVNYRLNGLSAVDFPHLAGPVAVNAKSESVESYRRFTMNAWALYYALDSVQFAISNEETRYYLNGVYMHVHDGGPAWQELRFVATDGHRMARQSVAVPEGAATMAGVILPKATVYTLLKLLKPAKGTEERAVEIELTATKIRFMFDDVTVTSKLVEETFPDYERVTPKNNSKAATVSVEAMQTAIKAVSMIATDRGGKAVKLAFDVPAGKLTLSVTNPDNGTAESSLPVTTEDFGGEYFEIGFNAKYLTNLVTEANAGGDSVTLKFNDSGSPTLVTSSRAGWLGVLMPMRV